jgi:ActR/RegA family two-component response regulator
MTDDDFQALLARVEGYRPGPWQIKTGLGFVELLDAEGKLISSNETYYPSGIDVDCLPLIEVAPALLEMVKELRAENAKMRETLLTIRDPIARAVGAASAGAVADRSEMIRISTLIADALKGGTP